MANPAQTIALYSKIETFVTENVAVLVPQDLFPDAEEKKELGKSVAAKFLEFVSSNSREFILPGFVFRPTEAELIDIVAMKNSNRSLNIIPELNLYGIHPQMIPALPQPPGAEGSFFFTQLATKVRVREFLFGFWKVIKPVKEITSGTGQKGEIRYLGLYDDSNRATVWTVTEFGLVPHERSGWVIYKVENTVSDGKKNAVASSSRQELQTMDLLSQFPLG